MDTSETSRSSSYVVGNDNAVSESSSGSSTGSKEPSPLESGDMKVESLDLASSEPIPESTSSSAPPPVQSAAVSTTPSTSNVSADVAVSSTSSEAESQEPAAGEVSPEPKKSAVEVGAADTFSSTPNSMAVDSSTAASSTPQENSELSNEAQSSKEDDGGEDDLGDNFDFLTSSGLMRKKASAAEESTVGAGDQGQVGVDSTQEPDTTNSMDLEAARAQAKEMMERFDAASSVTPAETTVHNGPV